MALEAEIAFMPERKTLSSRVVFLELSAYEGILL